MPLSCLTSALPALRSAPGFVPGFALNSAFLVGVFALFVVLVVALVLGFGASIVVLGAVARAGGVHVVTLGIRRLLARRALGGRLGVRFTLAFFVTLIRMGLHGYSAWTLDSLR